MPQEKTGTAVRNWSRYLGYAGLVPFAVLMLVVILADPPASTYGAKLLLAYGAVMLSFVGAVHWGHALEHPKAKGGITLFSVVPASVAWLSLLAPVPYGLGVQCVAFAVWFYYENNTGVSRFLPIWYKKLRLHLTAGACLTLAITALRTAGIS